MYEIEKNVIENYSCHRVRTEAQLWPCPFEPKIYRYNVSPLIILHRCMKYGSCTLKTSILIVSEPKCGQSLVVTFTFDILIPKCIGIFLSPSCIVVWNVKCLRWKLLELNRVRTKVLTKLSCYLEIWPLNPKMYRYLPLTILHRCMKYESCALKTSQVIVSEPKCWQSSVVTLTFDILIPNVYVSSFSRHHKSMYEILKLYIKNYSSYCVITNMLTKFSCDLDLWPFHPKMYKYLPLTILHLSMKYESCTLKTTQNIVSEP